MAYFIVLFREIIYHSETIRQALFEYLDSLLKGISCFFHNTVLVETGNPPVIADAVNALAQHSTTKHGQKEWVLLIEQPVVISTPPPVT